MVQARTIVAYPSNNPPLPLGYHLRCPEPFICLLSSREGSIKISTTLQFHQINTCEGHLNVSGNPRTAIPSPLDLSHTSLHHSSFSFRPCTTIYFAQLQYHRIRRPSELYFSHYFPYNKPPLLSLLRHRHPTIQRLSPSPDLYQPRPRRPTLSSQYYPVRKTPHSPISRCPIPWSSRGSTFLQPAPETCELLASGKLAPRSHE